jgi:hypothetical protein
MRPIQTDSTTAIYKESDQMGINTLIDSPPSSGKKRPKPEETTVESQLDELELFLETHWDVNMGWDNDRNRQQYQREIGRIHNGYLSAGRDLINQVGFYCAYCDIPVCSGLEVDQLLPKGWFPQEMFRFENLLPTCAVCRAKKNRKPDRSAGSAEIVIQQYAWPHLFWKNVADGSPLPFRYELLEVQGTRSAILFGKKLDETQYPKLLRDYQSGSIQTDEGWVVRYNAEGNKQPLALNFTTTTIFSPMSMTEGLVNQNDTSLTNDEAWVDHRVLSRTLTFFKALAFRDLLSTASASASEPLKAAVRNAARTAIKATGFWGVWLTVFRDNNEIQQVLKDVLPGTSAQTWLL